MIKGGLSTIIKWCTYKQPADHFAYRCKIYISPVVVGVLRKKGKDEGAKSELVFPQSFHALEAHDDRVGGGGDLKEVPRARRVGGDHEVGRGCRQHRRQHGHKRELEHGARVFGPEPPRLRRVLADDGPVGLLW